MKKVILATFLITSASLSVADSDTANDNAGGTPTQKVERLQQSFAEMDTEGKGFLSREIIESQMGITGEKFTNLDEDGDGVINRQEFLTLSLEGEAKGTEGDSGTPKPESGPLDRDDNDDPETDLNTQPQDRTP